MRKKQPSPYIGPWKIDVGRRSATGDMSRMKCAIHLTLLEMPAGFVGWA